MADTFEVSGALELDQVREVRRFVECVPARRVEDPDLRSRISLAAHEMCENAAKYAADGAIGFRLALEPGPPMRIRITTRNRAHPEHIAALGTMVSELHAAKDPLAHYVRIMRRDRDRIGGLGLSRIVAEAEMALAIEIDGGVVIVHADLVV